MYVHMCLSLCFIHLAVGALGGVDAMARGILSTECALAYLMGLVGGLVKPCLSDCGCILRSGCM